MAKQIAGMGVTISVVQQGGRILQLLIQKSDTVDVVSGGAGVQLVAPSECDVKIRSNLYRS